MSTKASTRLGLTLDIYISPAMHPPGVISLEIRGAMPAPSKMPMVLVTIVVRRTRKSIKKNNDMR